MSIEIDVLNGDASWPLAEPLFDAVWPRDVVEIAALPCDEPEILLARQRRADGACFGHRFASPRRRAAAFITAATML